MSKKKTLLVRNLFFLKKIVENLQGEYFKKPMTNLLPTESIMNIIPVQMKYRSNVNN